jgi:hypothetical protein
MASPKPKVTPTPTPTIPGPLASATAALPSVKPKPTASTSSKPPVIPQPVGKVANIEPINIGESKDWNVFLNGTLVQVASGPQGVNATPYIAGQSPTTDNPNPTGIAILPTATGFKTTSVDSVAAASMTGITASNIQYYKLKLRKYYPGGDKAFKLSYSTIDKDVEFQKAIKRAINELSVDNFQAATRYATALKANPNTPVPSNLLYDFDSYVLSRPDIQEPTSSGESTSNLTTQEDAYAEFNRTVKQYVGNPALVDKLEALREAYWQKLHKIEMDRNTTRITRTDIFGNTVANTLGEAPLTEQDRTEMRLGLIINGDKKIASTGIKAATQESLEDAGGLISQAYGKLKETAADYGIRLSSSEILDRTYRALKVGGVSAGLSTGTMATGIEQEIATIKQSAKAHFKGLSQYIDNGLRVSDISSNFQRMKENEMGLVEGDIDIYDDDVQRAIGGADISTKNDFILGVRSNPLWRKTPKANEMAATFINTILKSWGKVG